MLVCVCVCCCVVCVCVCVVCVCVCLCVCVCGNLSANIVLHCTKWGLVTSFQFKFIYTCFVTGLCVVMLLVSLLHCIEWRGPPRTNFLVHI